jgi:hypothetical protein
VVAIIEVTVFFAFRVSVCWLLVSTKEISAGLCGLESHCNIAAVWISQILTQVDNDWHLQQGVRIGVDIF